MDVLSPRINVGFLLSTATCILYGRTAYFKLPSAEWRDPHFPSAASTTQPQWRRRSPPARRHRRRTTSCESSTRRPSFRRCAQRTAPSLVRASSNHASATLFALSNRHAPKVSPAAQIAQRRVTPPWWQRVERFDSAVSAGKCALGTAALESFDAAGHSVFWDARSGHALARALAAGGPPMPKRSDGLGWEHFCFGGGRGGTGAGDGAAPSTTLLLRMSGPMAASVLAHHVETAAARWTEDGSLPDDVEHHMDGRIALGRARMVWLYALLCRLETPLVADDAATVRRL